MTLVSTLRAELRWFLREPTAKPIAPAKGHILYNKKRTTWVRLDPNGVPDGESTNYAALRGTAGYPL